MSTAKMLVGKVSKTVSGTIYSLISQVRKPRPREAPGPTKILGFVTILQTLHSLLMAKIWAPGWPVPGGKHSFPGTAHCTRRGDCQAARQRPDVCWLITSLSLKPGTPMFLSFTKGLLSGDHPDSCFLELGLWISTAPLRVELLTCSCMWRAQRSSMPTGCSMHPTCHSHSKGKPPGLKWYSPRLRPLTWVFVLMKNNRLSMTTGKCPNQSLFIPGLQYIRRMSKHTEKIIARTYWRFIMC